METSKPAIFMPPARVTVRGAKHGNAHAGGHVHGESAVGDHAIQAAHAQARVGGNFQIVARLEVALARHPRSHAARAVAADLGDGAVGIVQANAARLRPRPCKELNAVSANAGIARAQPPRQVVPIVAVRQLLPSQSESRFRRRAL